METSENIIDGAKKILIADDDEAVQTLVQRAFASSSVQVLSALNGVDAIRIAQEESPDLIILDVCMPCMDGKEVIKELRRNRQTQMIPVVMLTGSGLLADKIIGLELGADDYVTKPFDMDELRVRVKSVFRRNTRDLFANPLTRLPGNPAIEDAVAERVCTKKPFAFFYIDIDNFKAFNDAYGYAKGDKVIQDTASILLEMLKTMGRPDDLLGHIGGDDFVIVTQPQSAVSLAMAITSEFDRQAPSHYSVEDQAKGYITTKDRLGIERQFPLITLSIAIATTEKRDLSHYAKVVDIASEIKRHLKTLPERKGSIYLIDRRGDATMVDHRLSTIAESRAVLTSSEKEQRKAKPPQENF